MKRQFTILSQAWYADVCLKDADHTDNITFGMYRKNGGTKGEMSLTWSIINGETFANLKVYDDAWWLLTEFADVMEALSKNPHTAITPDQFAEMLIACNFTDATPHTDPKA